MPKGVLGQRRLFLRVSRVANTFSASEWFGSLVFATTLE